MRSVRDWLPFAPPASLSLSANVSGGRPRLPATSSSRLVVAPTLHVPALFHPFNARVSLEPRELAAQDAGHRKARAASPPHGRTRLAALGCHASLAEFTSPKSRLTEVGSQQKTSMPRLGVVLLGSGGPPPPFLLRPRPPRRRRNAT